MCRRPRSVRHRGGMDTVVTVLKYVGMFYLVLYSGLAVLVLGVTLRDRRARAAWEASLASRGLATVHALPGARQYENVS